MGLADDLNSDVTKIFADMWSSRDGQVIPEAEDLKLGNDAVKLAGTVLYADLAESTELVSKYSEEFAAEVYKAYLVCAAKVIRNNSGKITAYDGDRVMGVFIGGSKNTSAAKSALQINYCVNEIINPRLKDRYPKIDYKVRQAVGVDTSSLFVARTGVRGANDLVWVGRSANYAAKLCGLRDGAYASWITSDVYDVMESSVKMGGSPEKNMWESRTWTKYGVRVYRSSWQWKP